MLQGKLAVMAGMLLAIIGCGAVSDAKINDIASQHNEDKIIKIFDDEYTRSRSNLSSDRYQFYLKISNKYNLLKFKEEIEMRGIDGLDKEAIYALIHSDSKPSSKEVAIMAVGNPATFEYALRFSHKVIYTHIIENALNEIDNKHYVPNSKYISALELILKPIKYNEYVKINNLNMKCDSICKQFDQINARVMELENNSHAANSVTDDKIKQLENEYNSICLDEINSQEFKYLRPECQSMIKIMLNGMFRQSNVSNLNNHSLPINISQAEARKFKIYFTIEELKHSRVGSNAEELSHQRYIIETNKYKYLEQLRAEIDGCYRFKDAI